MVQSARVDPRAIRDAYDRSAGDYDRRFAPLQAAKYEAVLARVDVPRGARVLDVGGGTGLLLARLGLDRPAVVLDFSRPMLARAPAAAWRVVADVRRLPLADRRFDRVFAITSLLLPPVARAGAVRELARVVAPGGRVAVTVLRDEAAGLEDELRAAGLVPAPRFDAGQDVGWVCALA